MNKEFWEEVWVRNSIRFHQPAVNRHLVRWFDELKLAPEQKIFVPLCGKSLDMLWLLEQGLSVTGVELSDIAVAAFFQENHLEATLRQDGPFIRHRCDSIEILNGDFFALRREHLANVAALYDRAALIAFPPEMRGRYAEHLAELLPSKTRMLLISLEYSGGETSPPPFSVPDSEVRELFEPSFTITELATEDALPRNQQWQEHGVTELLERVYLLVRK